MIRVSFVSMLVLVLAVPGCRESGSHEAADPASEPWAVTAWGERYEIFAETAPLVAAQPAVSNVHVTVLNGFAPLKAGTVSAVLRGAGAEQVFHQDKPKREGIFSVEVKPASQGDFDLIYRVDGPEGAEEIEAGAVRVGSLESPGGPTRTEESSHLGSISFLKEQQWRTEFGTMTVQEGKLRDSAVAPGRVAPVAGGEATLTSPLDATVSPEPWPFPGQDVSRGRIVLRLTPRSGDRSLLDLEAEAAAVRAELEAARRREERLADLLRTEATSVSELERARATRAGLEARLQAAESGIGAVTGRGSPSSRQALTVKAPWSGRVAEVLVSPGQTVTSGNPLVRLVKVSPLWVVLAMRPEDAARAGTKAFGLQLRRAGSPETLFVETGDLRIVSRSPEVNPQTGRLDLIIEVDRSAAELPIGSSVEAELLLEGERAGIVVPASALVDDAGVAVAYVQLEGETFVRREIRVLGRQGDHVLVDGLTAGDRLVTRGGAAIRRSALLSTGAPEGHVH
jgi:RND family efflux transporter MFP subunit